MGLKFHSKILDVDNIDVRMLVFARKEERSEPVGPQGFPPFCSWPWGR